MYIVICKTLKTSRAIKYDIKCLCFSDQNVCLFAVWTGPNFYLKTAKIFKDDNFWNIKMKNKLINFYEKCLLPEYVDLRKTRSMPLRETCF